MFLRRSAVQSGRVAAEAGTGRGAARSQYHGSRTDGQYPGIRHVQFTRQSHGGGGHCRSNGRIDADAVHPGNQYALGDWCADRVDRRDTGAGQCVEMPVYMGRRHQCRQRRNDKNHGSLNPI